MESDKVVSITRVSPTDLTKTPIVERIFNGVRKVWDILKRIESRLETIIVNQQRIIALLERNDRGNRKQYVRPLSDYRDFEWEKIGARVMGRDRYGATMVEVGMDIYVRRSPDNKYESAIWFSRSLGEGNGYEKLIVFRDLEASELGKKARGKIVNG